MQIIVDQNNLYAQEQITADLTLSLIHTDHDAVSSSSDVLPWSHTHTAKMGTWEGSRMSSGHSPTTEGEKWIFLSDAILLVSFIIKTFIK